MAQPSSQATPDAPPGGGAVSFGPYRVIGSLAAGGMGVLYRAIDERSGAAVAIKTVVTFKGGVVDGIRSEIRALARLVHPGVARIVDEGIAGGHPWYAMELVEGRTLAKVRDTLWDGLTGADQTTHVEAEELASPGSSRDAARAAPIAAAARRQLPARPRAAAGQLPFVLSLIERLCAPLAYVHGRGIVHRDLKPENVLIKPDGTPVLIDFGVATRFPAALGREVLEPAGSIAGTVAYMAPEQFRRGIVDARADLYSLGCLLYEFVCGRRPFLGATSGQLGEAHLLEPPTAPSRIVDGVPPALEALMLRLLAKRPRDRIGYAADVADALGLIIAELARESGAPVPGPPRPAGRAADNRPRDEGDGFYLYRPEMTGRAEPAERLLSAANAARKGRGAIFFLGGESGIGKTMLAGEVGKQAAGMGLRVVTGDVAMFGRGTAAGSPLALFRRLLQTIADHCRARGPAATAQLMGQRGGLLAAVETAFEGLPGLAPGPLETDLTGEAARSAILTAMSELLFAFSREQPLLLVLDDVQWADELSLALLKLLAPAALANHPLLVIATYRTDEAAAALRELTSDPGAHDVRLGRLDEEGVRSMVTEMLGMNQPPRALVRFLTRTSEGNPFFVAEYVRAAVGEGVLYRHGGQWQLARGIGHDEVAYEALPLPNSLRGLIERRLQGLGPEVSALLEAASVIGRSVDPALLTAVTGREPPAVHDALAELLGRQVLEDDSGQLRFVHEKLREHAYDAIAPELRRQLHLRVALALEPRQAHAAHLLAFHFHAAGRPERAFHHAVVAGRQARSAGALHDAHDQLGKALSLEPDALANADAAPSTVERTRLRRMLGEARAGVGDLDGSEEILREAYTMVRRRTLPRGQLGWGLFALGQLAIQLGRRALGLQPRLPEDSRREALEEAATIANRLGFSFMVRGSQLPMLGVLTLAANLAERAHAPAARGIPYSILASMFGLLGAAQLSRRYFTASRRAVADARDVVAPLQQAQIEGFYYLNRGAWDAAREVLDPAFVRGQEVGIPYETGALGIARAWLEIMVGRPAAARALLAEVRVSAERLGNRLHEWWARRYEALALLQEGRAREALEVVAPAEAGFRARGGVVDLLNILAVQAIAYERLGDNDAALTIATEALAAAHGNAAAVSHSYELHAFLPEVFIRAWQRAQGTVPPDVQRAARSCLRAANRYARLFRIGQPNVLLNRARIAALEGRNREADRLRRRARSIAHELGIPFEGAL